VSLTRTSRSPTRNAASKRTKIFAISGAIALVVLLLTLWITMSVLAASPPAPSNVAKLLKADDAFNRPVNATFLTELHEEWQSGDVIEWALLEDRVAIQALDRLGLATVDHSNVQIPPDCYRYDEVIHCVPMVMSCNEYIKVRKPNGEFHKCDDQWRHTTTISLTDPDTVGKESITERIPTLSDLGLTRSGVARKGSSSSTSVPIGAIELVEVSDVVRVKGKDAYTVGFKMRFKPNSLGELFDISSPIFKSMPQQVRIHFVDPMHSLPEDKRLLYIDAFQQMNKLKTGGPGDGIVTGHAELIKEGLFNPHWKIKQVFFDQMDHTVYAFHRVE
jgi:hypothetical protein